MSKKLPYVNSTGLISKVLEKIKVAQTPDRFTQDFLGTKLSMKSGSAKALIPLLKRIGFLGSDGVPTDTYHKFRNDSESEAAMGKAIKYGFTELYSRNEYAHDLQDGELKGLVVSITGSSKDSSTVKAIVGTFKALKDFAIFGEEESTSVIEEDEEKMVDGESHQPSIPKQVSAPGDLGMNLAYTINIVLPETTNVGVYNAIFKSINENLLKK